MRLPVLDKLEKELLDSQKELGVEIPKALALATAMGDLSENAEYKAAKERQMFLEVRISQLQKRVSEISSLDIKRISKDKSGLGSALHVKHIETGKEKIYYLVFPEEVNPDEGKVSLASPVGKALSGKQVGDEVVLPVRREWEEFEIIKLSTIHEIIKRK